MDSLGTIHNTKPLLRCPHLLIMRETADTASNVFPPPVGILKVTEGTGRPTSSLRELNGLSARALGSLPSPFKAFQASSV